MGNEGPNLAYVALGSNIEPEKNLPAAVEQLQEFGLIQAVSQVWQTEPVGDSDQADFLNAAVLLVTDLSAEDVIDRAIPQIECRLERVRDPLNKNGPRTIDLDLVLFNSECRQIGRHQLPDPDILTRLFVASPLAELTPNYVHPESGKSLRALAAELGRRLPPLTLRSDVKLLLDGKLWPTAPVSTESG